MVSKLNSSKWGENLPMRMEIKDEIFRILATLTLLSIFCILSLYSGHGNSINSSFPFSMLMVTFWWKKRTWLAPVLLIGIIIFILAISFFLEPAFTDAYYRLVMVLLTVIMVAFLFERIEKVRILNQMNEKLKKRTENLEDANNELEAFAYSVSHDLRVPLRAIDGFSRIVMEDYEDKLDDEGKRLLGIIRENTKKMGQLIDDILLLSRASRQEMKFTPINMEDLVKNVFEEQKLSTDGQNVRLELKSLPNCYGDRALLQQVLNNLIANSIKFTAPKEEGIIEVGAQNGSDENIYYIKDNGVGFDMKYSNKLFGLFQRLHGASEFEGTGVGLSIVQRVIRRHGGTVWGEGELNKGATFYFSLPKS